MRRTFRGIQIVPPGTNIDFVGRRKVAYAISLLMVIGTAASLWFAGLNLGLDFTGGVIVEAASEQAIDIGALRERLNGTGLGEIAIQHIGSERAVQIRVSADSDESARSALQEIRGVLGDSYELRRSDAVGPTVSGELFRDGLVATLLAVAGITVYVWARFEWQFGVSALVATGHDVLTAIGLMSAFQIDFNLSSVAALLTLAGYSINDTIVIFDRVRENMRKYKTVELAPVINRSINDTLSRTVATSGTTLLAVAPLLIFGGALLASFTVPIAFGIVVGTFSSVYVAAALLLHMPPVRSYRIAAAETPDGPESE